MIPLPPIPLAYIDPGSGSLLIQVLIGSLLAAPFFLRTQIGRIYRAIRHREPRRRPDERSEPTTGEG
jgi:hypothetical protein